MSDLVGIDREQLMKRGAAIAAATLRKALPACRAVEVAARDYDRALPMPDPPGAMPYAHGAAQNSVNSVADAARTLEWIAAGCPKPGEK